MSLNLSIKTEAGSRPPVLSRGCVASILMLACYLLGLAWHGWPLLRVLTLAAVFVAACVASIAGFAFSLICAPLLLPLVAEPVALVRIMLVGSLAIQAMSMWLLRDQLEWKRVTPFLLGGAGMLPVSLGFLSVLPRDQFSALVGFILVAQGSWLALLPSRSEPRRMRFFEGVVAGLAGGITGGLLASPGLPVAAWCSWSGWSRQQQRGVFAPFIFLMQILTVVLLWLLVPTSRTDEGFSWTLLAYIPPALVGAICGLQTFQRISDRAFGVLVNALLILAGAVLVLG